MSRAAGALSLDPADSNPSRPSSHSGVVSPVFGLASPALGVYLTFVLPFPRSEAMVSSERLSTTVSTKGQVILPKAIREHRQWKAGTRLEVEDTADGVLLRAAPAFAPTHPEDVFGSLPYKGTPKTLEEMDAGIAAEAKRRHAGNRY
jgi:AbrB family looped-hinge helix DNA binding protein